jgi:hypothetical protein
MNSILTSAWIMITWLRSAPQSPKPILSTIHATLLLEIFHRQPCCYDEAAADVYEAEKEEMFKGLYGSTPAIMRRQEGLRMGKILLSQGQLEEAVLVTGLFARMATEELGDDDPVTVEAKRLFGIAEKERAEELEDEKEGRVSMRWGSVMFMRDVSEL